MTIVLPSLSSQLAPAIEGITAGIQKLVNPNYELQRGMQAAIMQNPGLIRQFADLEAASPGISHRLGLGPLSDLIASVPESTESEFGRANKDLITRAKKGKLESEAQGAELDVNFLNQIGDLIAKDPATALDAVYKRLGIDTPLDKKAKTLNNKILEARVTEIDRAEELMQQVPALMTKYKSVYDIAKGLMSPKGLSPEDSRVVFSDAALARGVLEAGNAIAAEKQYANQRQLQNIMLDRQNLSRTQRLDQLYETNGIDQFQKSNVGTVDAWIDVMKHGIDSALSKKDSKDPADRPYKQIAEYFEAQHTKEEQAHFKKVQENISSITGLQARIDRKETQSGKKASEGERQSDVASLNILLQQRSELGGPLIRAEWSTKGFNRLHYYDQTGKELTDKQALSSIVKVGQQGPQLSATAQTVLENLKNNPNPTAMYNAYKLKKGLDHGVVKEIEELLKVDPSALNR